MKYLLSLCPRRLPLWERAALSLPLPNSSSSCSSLVRTPRGFSSFPCLPSHPCAGLCSSAQPQPPSPLAFVSILVSPLPSSERSALHRPACRHAWLSFPRDFASFGGGIEGGIIRNHLLCANTFRVHYSARRKTVLGPGCCLGGGEQLQVVSLYGGGGKKSFPGDFLAVKLLFCFQGFCVTAAVRGAAMEGPGLSIPKDLHFFGAWQDAECTQRVMGPPNHHPPAGEVPKLLD